MNTDDYNKLLKISEEILNCRECDFYKELKGKFSYKPDAPLLSFKKKEYKVMAIGINPGWENKYEELWRDAYKETDFIKYQEKFKEAAIERSKKSKRDPYRVGLTNTFNEINNHLKIYVESDIGADDIYDYLFWANLSFCSSQNPWKREMFGEKLDCRVYSEEIPNCLEKNYLKSMIKIIDPKLILFFTISASGYIYYKNLLKKLLGIDRNGDIIVPNKRELQFKAHMRNGKEIKTSLIPCKIEGRNTRILFLPHPNYHFESNAKKEAIKYVCNWLEK